MLEVEDFDFIIMQMKNGQSFHVERVYDDGSKALKATLIEKEEGSRGVVVEYDVGKSLEDNLMDLYVFMSEFLETDRGRFLFGE